MNNFSSIMKNFYTVLVIISYFSLGTCIIPDWLVKKVNIPSHLVDNSNDDTLTLTNGIISRTFCVSPGFATIDFYSHEKNSSLLRALGPEVTSFLNIILTCNYLYEYK